MNNHQISGRLTRKPEMVGVNGEVAKFSVAVDAWDHVNKEKVAEFFDCVAFGKTAETIEKYAEKGTFVIIRGKQRSRTYENKSGNKVKAWELIVDEFELGPRTTPRDADPEEARDESSPPVKLWT